MTVVVVDIVIAAFERLFEESAQSGQLRFQLTIVRFEDLELGF